MPRKFNKKEAKENLAKEGFELLSDINSANEEITLRCEKGHNIKLIRIPYWDFKNIENILKQELNLE